MTFAAPALHMSGDDKYGLLFKDIKERKKDGQDQIVTRSERTDGACFCTAVGTAFGSCCYAPDPLEGCQRKPVFVNFHDRMYCAECYVVTQLRDDEWREKKGAKARAALLQGLHAKGLIQELYKGYLIELSNLAKCNQELASMSGAERRGQLTLEELLNESEELVYPPISMEVPGWTHIMRG